ncbi:MAG: FAD-dependent oxidoreductase, partial [Bacteroidota bacterium]
MRSLRGCQGFGAGVRAQAAAQARALALAPIQGRALGRARAWAQGRVAAALGLAGALVLVAGLAVALAAGLAVLPVRLAVVAAAATTEKTVLAEDQAAAPAESKPAAPAGVETQDEYDILIYGGSFTGVAAAITAASVNPSASILLANPQTALGSIGTVGGQNYMDVRSWPGDPHAYLWNKGWQRPYVTMGTYDRIFAKTDRAYNTDEAAALLEAMVREHPNVTIVHDTDVVAVGSVMATTSANPATAATAVSAVSAATTGTPVPAATGPGVARLTGVTLQKVRKDPVTGYVMFDAESKPWTVRAKIFVDASDNGRLTRLSGHFVGTLGRAD